MKRLYAGLTAAAVFAATVLTPLQAAVPTATIGYLQGQSKSNEWVVMALKASGQTVSASQIQIPSTNAPTALERIILGVVAGGENPTNVQGRNLLAELDAKRVNNQIGDANLLNDDIWGILAYYAAGISASDARIQASKQFLVDHQNADGGWGYDIGGDSDSNDTAMAITALIRSGMTGSDSVIDRAFGYLSSTQTDSGGYAISPDMEADSASTSWVISALQAAGKNPNDYTKNGNTPFSFLQSTEDGDGAFKWKPSDTNSNVSMTAYAAIAYAGTSYPVHRFAGGTQSQPVQQEEPAQPEQTEQEPEVVEEQGDVQQGSTSGVDFRIEGDDQQLCSGNVEAGNALEVIEKAALICDLSYVIQETSFGPYVQSIEGQEANGSLGWLYIVNWEKPSVGAVDYLLEDGDYVTWYFGEFDSYPLRLSINTISETSEEIRVDVQVDYYDGEVWSGARDAFVRAGSQSVVTPIGGQVSVSLAQGQPYLLYATGDGYIRSAVQTIRSSDDMSVSLPLETTIVSEGTIENTNTGGGTSRVTRRELVEIPEPEVSFTVNPLSGDSLLSFGNLEPGSSGSQMVELKNTGNYTLEFSATVEGDALFKDHVQIDQKDWDQFSLELNANDTEQVDVRLEIPSDYAQIGKKEGELIFWATP